MILGALPDPSDLGFVLALAALGAFIGATVGRVRRRDRDDLRRVAENWAYVWTAAALAVYLVLLVLDLLS